MEPMRRNLLLVILVLILAGGSYLALQMGAPEKVAAEEDLTGLLNRYGLAVMEVKPSGYADYFRGSPHRAAQMQTDKGTLHVIFFPDKKTADGIQLFLQRDRKPGEYRYTVQMGQQKRVIERKRPLHLIRYGNLFILTESLELESDLREALSR